MSDDPQRTCDAVFRMASDLGWRVVDDRLQYGQSGRWSYHADVETDMGLARFQTRYDDDTILFTSLWYGGFDLTVSRQSFIAEALHD